MERVILHSDVNNFYASVECLYNPEIRNKPVAVCGDAEARHGIVLAKNYIAKKYNIQTGDAIWEAKQKCRDLVVVPPSYDKYMHFSKVANEIYSDYTDQVEGFGLDESWLDVSGSTNLFGDGKAIADKIRDRIKFELGVTVSVGVSFNKVFAKLGSDMKKPDATTVISKADFQEKIWGLPVKELLYVGKATYLKLQRYNIKTIGDLANTDKNYLKQWFGKSGEMLWLFANGLDNSPVKNIETHSPIKSIGNSTTTPRDLVCNDDVKLVFCLLAESVAERLRKSNLKCRTVQIWVRDSALYSFERQQTLNNETNISTVISDKAMDLFIQNCKWERNIRSIGVRACNLCLDNGVTQLSLLMDEKNLQKLEQLEYTIDNIREKYGHFALQRGIMLKDRKLSGINPIDENTIHPVAFFE